MNKKTKEIELLSNYCLARQHLENCRCCYKAYVSVMNNVNKPNVCEPQSINIHFIRNMYQKHCKTTKENLKKAQKEFTEAEKKLFDYKKGLYK